jgi:hypothetical protein
MDDLDVEALLREADPAEPAYLGDVAAALRAGRSTGPQRRAGGAGRRWLLVAAAALVAVLVGALVLVAGHDERPVEHEPPATPQPVTEPGVLVDRWVGAPRVATATGAAFVDIGDDMLVQRTGDPNAGTAWASSWTVADGVLTLDLLGTERGCEPGAVGTYRVSGPPGSSTLTLEAIDDTCAERAAALAGTWVHTACRTFGTDCLGAVDAGEYRSVAFDPLGDHQYGELGYTLPAGWAVADDTRWRFAIRPAAEYLADDNVAEFDNDYGISLWADAAAVVDPCSGDPDAGAVSPTEIAAALAARDDLVVERSTGSIAGVPAEVVDVVDVHLIDGADADCADGGQAVIASRLGPPTPWQVRASRGDRLRIAFVDLAGRTMAVVLADDSDPSRFDALVAAAQPIVESFALAVG